jgi:adenosylcobyric acid synthase
MNPILLKPQPGGSQIIVRGQVHGHHATSEYFGSSRREQLWPIVTQSLDRLRAEHDLVIAEGAGSPAEINLRSGDIVNMQVALYAGADVLLVADIDRGGAFAALLGTWEWFSPKERALVKGFILNKFRGDASLLDPAPALLEERTGVPVIGVVPYLQNLGLPEEDAASLDPRMTETPYLEIAVVRLPHLANFNEFGALAAEPGVQLRWVTQPQELRAPDLVILPGTKATIPDLLWLHEWGLADRICWLATHRTPILGICGGYQMLCASVRDPAYLESAHAHAVGLQLLSVTTELGGGKRLARVHGRGHTGLTGFWAAVSGASVDGYEIDVGRTSSLSPDLAPLVELDTGSDGAVGVDGLVAGTYLHGLLEQIEIRRPVLESLASMRGFPWTPPPRPDVDPYDRLATVLADSIRLAQISPGDRERAGSLTPPVRAIRPP